MRKGVGVEGAGDTGDQDKEENDLCDRVGNDGKEEDPVPGVGEIGDAREVYGRRTGGGEENLPQVGGIRDGGDVRHPQRPPELAAVREGGRSLGTDICASSECGYSADQVVHPDTAVRVYPCEELRAARKFPLQFVGRPPAPSGDVVEDPRTAASRQNRSVRGSQR